MGVCASSGGMFNNYSIVQGVDHIVPVDIYLPGCPPRPEMLLDAILKLHDRIENMKLGKNRERQIEELEQAQLARLPLHTQALPSQQLLQLGDRSALVTAEHARTKHATTQDAAEHGAAPTGVTGAEAHR